MPLLIARGAGAEMRRTLGTAVFSGMLGVTLFGIFLTPVFFDVDRLAGQDARCSTRAAVRIRAVRAVIVTWLHVRAGALRDADPTRGESRARSTEPVKPHVRQAGRAACDENASRREPHRMTE